MYSCNKTWHWVERTYKATVISSRLCHSSVVQLYYLLRLWLCVLRLLGSLCTSETCLRHRRLSTCTTNVQSWKIFPSIKTLLPSHISLTSFKLPPELMFDSRISNDLLLLRFRSHSLPSPSDAVHSELSHVVQVSSLVLFFTRHFVPRSPFGRAPRGYGLQLLIFKMANNKVDLGHIRSEEIVYGRCIKIPLG